MDDETYIKANVTQLPGLEFYVATSQLARPEEVRAKNVENIAEKILIWQPICGCGTISQSYITTATIDRQIYWDDFF